MTEPTNRRNPLTLLVAIMAMVVVLLAPPHEPSAPFIAELSFHEGVHGGAGLSVAAHANQHGASHDHVHDIISDRLIGVAALSIPKSAWRASTSHGAPLSLDLTPFQPPRT